MLRFVHETVLGESAEQFESAGSHSDPNLPEDQD
jgi:hypothetical protein